uniref:transcription intermediary factor 1-beta-like n=1 Tax=Monopterus albus TaxID=43700 RepID=UPI0009B49D52|nr:transcription intermediary factor 1-beta-like [Monopterus albus]
MSSNLNMDTTGSPESSQQCGTCNAASFSCWCVDCREALCAVCVSAHRRVSVTRFHKLLNQPPAGSILTPPTKFCRQHPTEPLKLFCFTCNKLTCRDCQLMTHMNHR